MKTTIGLLLSLGFVFYAYAAPPEETIVNADDVPWVDGFVDGITFKQFPGELLRLQLSRFERGSIAPMHSHVNEQILMVQSGRYRATIEGREHILEEGDVIVVPSHALHGFEALEDSTHIEAFAPSTMYFRAPE